MEDEVSLHAHCKVSTKVLWDRMGWGIWAPGAGALGCDIRSNIDHYVSNRKKLGMDQVFVV